MAAKIRLQKVGAKGRPSYRVVVADESAPRGGKIIEEIGHYNPLLPSSAFNVDKEKVLDWIKKGAKPTESLRVLLGKAQILPPVSFEGVPKKPPKAKKEAKPEEEKKPEAKKEEKSASGEKEEVKGS